LYNVINHQSTINNKQIKRENDAVAQRAVVVQRTDLAAPQSGVRLDIHQREVALAHQKVWVQVHHAQ
jgi:hypothetical protein